MCFIKHLLGESRLLAPWDAVRVSQSGRKHGGTHGAALLGRRLGSAVSAHRLPRRAGKHGLLSRLCCVRIHNAKFIQECG